MGPTGKPVIQEQPEQEQQLVNPQQDVKMKGEMPSHSLVEIKTEMPSYSASEPSSSGAPQQVKLPSGDLLGKLLLYHITITEHAISKYMFFNFHKIK